MGGSSFIQTHFRSISLPNKLHTNSLKIKTLQQSLSFSTPTASHLSASDIQLSFAKLTQLYDLINPHHTHHHHVEKALDRSILLLDSCQSTKEVLSTLKEKVQDLQSALRRRGGDFSSIKNNLSSYLTFRKKSKKDINKCFKSLKQVNNDEVVEELIEPTIALFRSLLVFLWPRSVKGNDKGWSLLSKLMNNGHEREQKSANEVESVDFAVSSVYEKMVRRNVNAKLVDLQMTLKRLETLNVSIKIMEDELDDLRRHLIKHRISLLNVLTPSI